MKLTENFCSKYAKSTVQILKHKCSGISGQIYGAEIREKHKDNSSSVYKLAGKLKTQDVSTEGGEN